MEIEELPDLKVNWIESYKYLAEPLLEYVWEVANHLRIRSFISVVALLVKVTASILRYARGFCISSFIYSTASVNVFPEPAEAL